ncbi:MAG: kinase [Steroidobacteraceae bacterium]
MSVTEKWVAEYLERERLPASFRRLIDDVHGPIARHIAMLAAGRSVPLQVGICGSQASGKSTLVAVLKALLDADALPTAVLSLDDIYSTRAERAVLARQVHPLLITRGVPGTHDVPLGIATLDRLGGTGLVALPSFDKQTDDRRAPAAWPVAQAPVRVAIFEGWCVGALPQPDAVLAAPVNALERDEDGDVTWRRYANDALRGEYQRLFRRFDILLLLQAPSFDVVYEWRCEQERKLRERVTAAGGDLSRVMTEAGIARFIAHYERLTRHILEEMPGRADIVLSLDAARVPLGLRGV